MNKIEERWERDNIIMKKELIDVAHNFSPQFGYRHFTRNAVHFSSKNTVIAIIMYTFLY